MQRENNLIYKGIKVRPITRFSTAKQMPEANGKKIYNMRRKNFDSKISFCIPMGSQPNANWLY